MKKNRLTKSVRLFPSFCEQQKEIQDFGNEIHKPALGLKNLGKTLRLVCRFLLLCELSLWVYPSPLPLPIISPQASSERMSLPLPPRPLTPQARRSGAKNPVHSILGYQSYRRPSFFVTWVRSLLFTLYICTVSQYSRDHTVSFSVLYISTWFLQLMVCCMDQISIKTSDPKCRDQ